MPEETLLDQRANTFQNGERLVRSGNRLCRGEREAAREDRQTAKEILDICKANDMPNGFWHTTMDNVERLINDGYRYLMAGPTRSFSIVNKGREVAGR